MIQKNHQETNKNSNRDGVSSQKNKRLKNNIKNLAENEKKEKERQRIRKAKLQDKHVREHYISDYMIKEGNKFRDKRMF